MATENEFTAEFAHDKTTTGTERFQEVTEPGEPPKIRTLYLQKWVASGWKKVRVTVERLE